MSIGAIVFPIPSTYGYLSTADRLIIYVKKKVHSTRYTFIHFLSKGNVWKAFSQLYCLSPP